MDLPLLKEDTYHLKWNTLIKRITSVLLWTKLHLTKTRVLLRLFVLCDVSSPTCWAAGVSLHSWMSCWSRFSICSLNMK